jgi:sugar lactone lactonase YvrE
VPHNEQGDPVKKERREPAALKKASKLRISGRQCRLLVACVGLLLVAGASSALAEEGSQGSQIQPSTRDYEKAAEEQNALQIEGPQTDPRAAEELPRQELGREGAQELLSSVFGEVIQESAATFDELENVTHFYSDHVAVIASEDQTGISGPSSELQPVLEESVLPLRAENSEGEKEAVDLELTHNEGELQPVNPLVEVGIPDQLGEGILLPEAGIEIKLAGAPSDRSASTEEEGTAFYPNVGTDSDLTILPTPTGVETLTQLRSADAPHSETFNLSLPDGASLEEIEGGGVLATQGGYPLVKVEPPTAVDAKGQPVPASLTTRGHSITVEVTPSAGTAFPVLVDPVYESANFWQLNNSTEGIEDWAPASNSPRFGTPIRGAYGEPGLNIYSYAGPIVAGSQASWNWHVPRYFSDYENPEVGERPTTYIHKMTLSQLHWWIEEGHPYHEHPFLMIGIWDEFKGWWNALRTRNGIEGELQEPYFLYEAENQPVEGTEDTHVKSGGVAMATFETESRPRHLLVGQAAIQFTDQDYPNGIATGPSEWMNEKATDAIDFTFTDPGLGIYSMLAKTPKIDGGIIQWAQGVGCFGNVKVPCPRTWSGGFWNFEPKLMPQGEDYVEMIGKDPVDHFTDQKPGYTPAKAVKALVKVDHTAPSLTVSGTATEQATLGTGLPRYSVKINATDGTTAAPQSGVAKTVIKVDGKVESELAPGCATKNCEVSREWILEASKFSGGRHTIEVIATDAVGLSAVKTILLEVHPDRTPPSIALSGSITEQASFGTTRPRYTLKLNATDVIGADGSMGLASTFGTAGAGNGQFNHPADVAIDAKGNIWAVDENNNRIEKFNEKGEFLAKYGATGSGNGQLNHPASLAIDTKGNVWVADAGNNRIEEFSEAGAFINASGSYGNGNNQFSSPEGIAIDAKGNVWVSDTLNGRIQKFNEKGEFIKVVGTKGIGTGQLLEPTGIDFGSGNVWVADWSNNKIVEFNEAGEYVRQVGSMGSGNGQFSHPDAIDVDEVGNVWVGDQSNGRVEEFGPTGAYLYEFGSKGSGSGQFSFSYPMGIDASKGAVWVTDTNNNRLQKWTPALGSNSGVVSTSIKVDGKVVDSISPGCPSGGCAISREWFLDSSSYSPGQHVVEATATDGAGLSTSKSATVSIERDTTAPEITASSTFFTAPEGWVEQQTYSYSASATDIKGYGSTSLALKIDGAVIKTSTQTCQNGGCEELLSGTINTSSYSGGAHPAELIATDGAGNVKKRFWTMNVDPNGQISSSEAIETLEAAEATSPINAVGEAQEEEKYEGTAANLGVESADGELAATGTAVPTTISTDPSQGLTMQALEPGAFCEGEGTSTSAPCETSLAAEEGNGLQPIQVAPVSTATGASEGKLVEGSAVISSNTSSSVDSIVRPLYDGALTFKAIRDPSAPEIYSWNVSLAPGQKLESLNEHDATVYYESGEPAFTIEAVPAADAIGSAVPTILKVTGDSTVSLTVKHHDASPAGGSFVYPIVAGAGWHGGFQTFSFAMPPTEKEREEVEAGEEEVGVVGKGMLKVPTVKFISTGPPVAQASGAPNDELQPRPAQLPRLERKFKFTYCVPHNLPTDPVFDGHAADSWWNVKAGESSVEGKNLPRIVSECHREDFEGVFWGVTVNGKYHYVYENWVWQFPSQWGCHKWGEEQPTIVHCKALVSEQPHGPVEAVHGPLNVIGEYRFANGQGQWVAELRAACFTEGGQLYPNPRNLGEPSVQRPMIFENEYVIPGVQNCNWR